MSRYALLSALVLLVVQPGPASAQVPAPAKKAAEPAKKAAEPAKQAPRVERRPDGPLTDADVHALEEILDAQAKGETDRLGETMRRTGTDVPQLERHLARVIYALLDSGLARATQHFQSAKDATYTDPLLGMVVPRAELDDWRRKLGQQIEVEYRALGGMEGFRKDRAIALKRETTLARRVPQLYRSGKRAAEAE